MALEWSDDLADVDWAELAALYRAAPLGDKSAADLKVVFANSRFRLFVRQAGALVGAGRALADGRDEAFGFRRMTTAMAIFENPAKAVQNGSIERA